MRVPKTERQADITATDRDTRQPDITATVENSDLAGLFKSVKVSSPNPTSQAKGLGDGPSVSHSSKKGNLYNS